MARRMSKTVFAAVPLLALVLGSAACSSGLLLAFLRAIGFAGPADPGQDKAAVVHTLDVSYLGSAAHIRGAADTDWRSDVELHNASNEGATVTLELLVHGEDNSAPESADFFLGPRRSLLLTDILASSFEGVEKAALRVRTSGGAILATNRTYNLLADGNALGLPEGATFGQYIPLRSEGSAVVPGVEARLIGLTHSEKARSNLGLVNQSPGSVRVRVEAYLADGSLLGSFAPLLEPFEYRQFTRVFERVTQELVADGYLIISTNTEGGRVLAQASVVDATTGDPVFVPAARITTLAGREAEPLWIVAAAHTAGAAGTNWRTDLEIHNPGDSAVDYIIELLQINENNSEPLSVSRSLAAGNSVRFEDALIELFEFEGTAALKILPTGGPLLATSRTYNLLGEGNPAGLPPGATFGQYIPAVTTATAITPDCEGRLIHLSHDASSLQGYRTNLVLVNGTEQRALLEVDLVGADAVPLGTISLSLKPFEYRQINNLFRRVTDEGVDDGYASLRLLSNDGAAFALASVVDNLSGDPTGMMATPVRSPAADGVVGAATELMELLGGAGVPYPFTLEDIAAWTQNTEGGVFLDGLELAFPQADVSAAPGVVTVNFGDGVVVDGITLSGAIELGYGDLNIDDESVRGRIVERYLEYSADGHSPLFDEIAVDVDLDVDADGRVTGTIGLSGSPTAKTESGAVLEGSIGIGTGICLHYPISGSISFTSPEGEAITISFGPECDGSFTTNVEPAWDWEYRFQDPLTNWAKVYITSTQNAHVTSDSANYWIPDVGGTEFYGRDNPGDTTPGVITYHFAFANPVFAAHLATDTPAFNFEWGRGHNYLLASRDGAEWVVINEAPPPNNPGDPPNSGWFIGALPPAVLGGSELWIRVELYAFGTHPPNGATVIAQHARFWESSAHDTFVLQVACVNGACGGS